MISTPLKQMVVSGCDEEGVMLILGLFRFLQANAVVEVVTNEEVVLEKYQFLPARSIQAAIDFTFALWRFTALSF